MANTYTQIHIHGIFAVQNRISLITESWREELYKYITGIVQNRGHKMLQIGGMSDHIHVLFGMRPNVIQYITNQPEHHKKRDMVAEYIELLKIFNVEYDERYVFKSIE